MRLLTGRSTSIASNSAVQLKSEYDQFQAILLPTGFDNSIQWACSAETTGYVKLRHIIMRVLTRPFTSVPAEQVFSVARFQTSPWSSTLNTDDFETRVVLAYNRRNYDFLELCGLLGVGGFIVPHIERQRLQATLSNAIGIPIGASARRNTESARNAKLAKVALQRAASSPPVVTRVISAPVPKRTAPKRPASQIESDTDDDSNMDFSAELHFLERTKAINAAARQESAFESTKGKMIQKLSAILENYGDEPALLCYEFDKLLSTTLKSLPNVDKLRGIIVNVRNEELPKLVKELKTGMEEGQDSQDLINLLMTGIDTRLKPPDSAGPSDNITSAASASSAPQALQQPTQTGNLYEELLAHQAGSTDEQVLGQGLAASFNVWSTQKKAYQQELEHFKAYMIKIKCVLANVPSDGSCLYHAIRLALIAFRVKHVPTDHLALRTLLVDYMEKQNLDWFPFRSKQHKTAYIAKQREESEWGDDHVVKAAAFHWERVFAVTTARHGTTIFDGRSAQAANSAHLELVLVCYKHYMFACPQDRLKHISQDIIPSDS